MENRLKERLTGAAILVALIVLLVPEMFHGQRSDVPASTGGVADGPPLRSYTIDLSNGPTRTAPLQSTPPSSALPVPSDATSEPAAAHAPASPPAPGAIAPDVPSRPGTVSSSSSTAGAAAVRRAPGANWSVQLGMFAQRENAERLLRAAQAKGFAVSVSSADGKGLFRVRTSALVDHVTAQGLQQRLRDQGFAATIVTP
ncbi:MAG: SPOR domain-containing protein [Steroidobacteraceae bacterium]